MPALGMEFAGGVGMLQTSYGLWALWPKQAGMGHERCLDLKCEVVCDVQASHEHRKQTAAFETKDDPGHLVLESMHVYAMVEGSSSDIQA